MVTERESLLGLLREYEDLLPLQKASVGSFLRNISDTVIPVIALNAFDTDGPAQPVTANVTLPFGQMGELKGIEPGAKSLTSAGTQSHIYVIGSGGVPAGEIWILRNLSIQCDDATTRQITAFMTGFSIALLSCIVANTRTGGSGTKNLLGRANDEGLAAEMFGQDRVLVMYPGSVLTVQVTGVANTKKTTCSMIKERYDTSLVAVDGSGDIDASAI